MKKSLMLISAAAALLAAGCARTEPLVEVETPEIQVPVDPWTVVSRASEVKPAIGAPSTLTATFSGTKSSLDMNAAGTFADYSWNVNDKFSVISDEWYYADYTCGTGGTNAAFTASGTVSGATFTGIYPGVADWSSAKIGTYSGTLVFGINIPTQQEAVAGNVKSGYLISSVTTDDLSADLHFKNAVSLLKFRLDGSIVSKLKSVTLKGVSSLAGDCILISGDTPEITFNITFTGDEASRQIVLSGTFEKGVDYYFTLAPGVQSTLSMVFEDTEGNTMTKIASKSIEFKRSQIADFGTIDIGDKLEEPSGLAHVKYMEATSGYKPVTIAVIPEGFTEAQLSDYEALAKAGINALFATEPYKSYKEYFNVWILKAASNESGATVTDGKGVVTEAHDTYFNARWGDGYADMEADDDKVFAFVEDNCPDVSSGIHNINEVPILMIINDERYGGICWSWGSGKGYAMVPFTYGGGTMGWGYPDLNAKSDSDPSQGYDSTPQSIYDEVGQNYNGNWTNTLVHEYGGHCFGRLTDEYWYNSAKSAVSSISAHSWLVPMALNISATYASPSWQELLDRRDALVASNSLYSRIGVFQGGDGSILNRWRNERISCMIDNRFYFSAWQRVLIVKRIMSLAGATFDMNSFLAKDSPVDPIRDIAASPVQGSSIDIPVRMMPPLPSPVLVNE